MQMKSQRKRYDIVLEFHNGMTRTIKVKAIDRETAERRALKFNPNALRVKQGEN